MKLRFYIDEETGLPHFYKHNVTDEEIIDFFHNITYFDERRPDDSWLAYGRVKPDRYLKVIFRKNSNADFFIITAYDIDDSEIIRFIEDYYEGY